MVKVIKINTINDTIIYNKNKKHYDKYSNIMYIYLLKSCYYCNELKPKLIKLYDILRKKKDKCLIIEIDAEFLPQTNIPYVSAFPNIVFFKNKKKIEFIKERTLRNMLLFYKSNIKNPNTNKKRKNMRKSMRKSMRKKKN